MSECERIIAGGQVVNGSGAARIRADIGIAEGRIAAVGDLSNWTASEERIEAGGLIVAPGFIDVHTHDDRLLLAHPDMAPKVSQGVTTVVVGNCGISLAPLSPAGDPPPPLNLLGGRGDFRFPRFAAYAEALDAAPAAINAVALVGHSTLRAAVMDDLGRAATAKEIARMGNLLDEALAAGCAGLSAGLAYPTAKAAPTEEVTALAARLRPAGGIFTLHLRDEAAGVVASVEEAIEIGRQSGVPVVISHHKCCGRANWGLSAKTLDLIAAARASGLRVDLDTYPYTASSTVLLKDFVARAERVLIAWSGPHPETTGRDLAEIAEGWGVGIDAAIDRLLPAGAVYFQMDEDDLRRILAFERTMVGSDGLPHDVRPHPRLWGTFPRVLGHYARDGGLFSLEEAIFRMTGNAARVFGLADRGRIAAGAAADIVLLDEANVRDRATYDKPFEPSAGIHRVLVNGETVWRDGAATGSRPGRLLRRNGGQ
ncbi:N-acyl-D-amino-acid deacylase family protein [Shumkonia mesophila]|uniref:N-acyl-D-amino-acid deacylase family protein n=1 Tax=Shumkonia mesophila TaxID=2838854 RepID=UPI0029351949|nr:D-aminoacylase [Shumkonia mesophila]